MIQSIVLVVLTVIAYRFWSERYEERPSTRQKREIERLEGEVKKKFLQDQLDDKKSPSQG